MNACVCNKKKKKKEEKKKKGRGKYERVRGGGADRVTSFALPKKKKKGRKGERDGSGALFGRKKKKGGKKKLEKEWTPINQMI